jgi:hypothetical protein
MNKLIFICCFFVLFVGCKDKNVGDIEKFLKSNDNLTFQDAKNQFGEFNWFEEVLNTKDLKNMLVYGWKKKTIDGKMLYIKIGFSAEGIPKDVINIYNEKYYEHDSYLKNKFNEAIEWVKVRKMIWSQVDIREIGILDEILNK